MHTANNEQRQVPWFLLLVLFASTTINYIDRISISVLAPTLRDEFGMSNSDYAWAVNAFQFGYLIFYIVGGRLADRWGVKLALTVYILWWSGAGMLHALTTGALTLALFRFLLAMGEGGTWPTVLKAVAENVAGPIRSFSMGIVNSGSSVGALLAPPIVGWLALTWGWRAAFILTGALGIILLPLWLYAHARAVRQTPPTETQKVKGYRWLDLVRYKQTWAMFLGRGIGEPMYGFYLFWLPEYLTRERGMDIGGIAAVAWIPFVAADLGNMIGGGVSSWLIHRGWTAQRARRLVMWTMAMATMVGMAAPFVESVEASVAILALTCFFYMTWSVNVMILPSDWFATRNQGTVLGFSGAGNGLGNLIFNAAVGRTLDRTGSYRAVFVGIAFLVPLAQTLLHFIGGPIKRIDRD